MDHKKGSKNERHELAADCDHVLPFTIDQAKVRGRLVRLDQVVQTIISRHNYPPIINAYLAELCALLAGFVVDFKRQGVSTLQVSCDNGPIKFMVADITHDGSMRACASFDDEKLAQLNDDVRFQDLFVGGRMLYSVDMIHTHERYQTIVPIEGESFSEAMHSYFRQSEQIPTAVVIYRDLPPQDTHHYAVASLVLQQLPQSGAGANESERDDWLTNIALMVTVKKDEMLDKRLTSNDLLFRLFHERDIHVFTPHEIKFSCRCSREKSLAILTKFSPQQLYDMQRNDGKIHMTCDFCDESYYFAVDELSTK